MNWIVCGLLIFAFAAPSAIVGVPYALATQGVAVGICLCLVFTASTALGAILLIDFKSKYPHCKEFKDLARESLGENGEFWASVVQNGNFFLFLPVAISLVALSLQDVVDPDYEYCSDYFIFAVAGVCLLGTQIRELKNAALLSMLSGVSLAVSAALILYIVSVYSNDDKEAAQWVGNPQNNSTGFFKGMLGVTTAVWSYVPSFLVIELLDSVSLSARDMTKAVLLSAALNVLVYVTVGVVVVQRWGWDLDDPFTIINAWPAHSTAARIFSSLLVFSNLISYTLDSVALTKKYQTYILPHFNCDDWSLSACLRYAFVSSHIWVCALLIAVFTPNMFVTLAFVTAFTIPWVTMVFPALFVLRYNRTIPDDEYIESLLPAMSKSSDYPSSIVSEVQLIGDNIARRVAQWLALVGIVTFIVCVVAAVGKLYIPELRGDSIIGCAGWRLLNAEV